MNKISANTCLLFEKSHSTVAQILEDPKQLSYNEVAQLFRKLHSSDIKATSSPWLLKKVAQFCVGRYFISVISKKHTTKMLSSVAKNYQTEKVQNLISHLEGSSDYNPSLENCKQIKALVKNSPLFPEVQFKIRERAKHRWDVPGDLFDRIKFSSKLLCDEYISQLKKTSDNVATVSVERSEDPIIPEDKQSSDNISSSQADEATFEEIAFSSMPGEEEGTAIVASDEEPPKKVHFRDSQTLPRCLRSTDQFLTFLLESPLKTAIIKRLSSLAAFYASLNPKKCEEKFYAWEKKFKGKKLPISQENYKVDLRDYPRATPFIPLIEFVPQLLANYRKFHELFQDKAELPEINYDHLAVLLGRECSFGENTPEEKIASLLIPLLNHFVESVREKLKNPVARQEWIYFLKNAWQHPFYKIVFSIGKWIGEKGRKIAIKKGVANYVPLLIALKEREKTLPKAFSNERKDVDKQIQENRDKIVVYRVKAKKKARKAQVYQIQIEMLERNCKDLETYKTGLAPRLQARLEEIRSQIKEESAREAQLLDASIGNIYNEIYKKVIFSWIDKHDTGVMLSCATSYRSITVQLHTLLVKSYTFSRAEKDQKVKEIRQSCVTLIIDFIKFVQKYAPEAASDETEKELFSFLHAILMQMPYDPTNPDFTNQIWQNLIAPFYESVLKVPGLFSSDLSSSNSEAEGS